MVYRSDQQVFNKIEYWRSWKNEVLLGQTVYDDCDGFSLTAAELMIEYGIDPNNIFLCFCAIKWNGKLEFHLTCEAKDDAQQSWIVGDPNFQRAVRKKSVDTANFVWHSRLCAGNLNHRWTRDPDK